jgi:hypothetical protein
MRRQGSVRGQGGIRRGRSTHLKNLNQHDSTAHIPTLVQWPEKLRQLIVNACNRPIHDKAIISLLEKEGWPIGLAHGLIRNVKKIPLRFFLVDDSGISSHLSFLVAVWMTLFFELDYRLHVHKRWYADS